MAPRVYQRESKPAVVAPLRFILMPFTPEEKVRQDFVRCLLEDAGLFQGGSSR